MPALRSLVLLPCGPECAFAQPAPATVDGDAWLWCAHPASPVRLVRPGRECPRFTVPTAAMLAARDPRRPALPARHDHTHDTP